MLWLLMTTTGGLTSGTSDFPTKEACEAARLQLGQMVLSIAEKRDGKRVLPMIEYPIEIRCVQKATGKP